MIPILFPKFKNAENKTPMSFSNGDFNTNGIGRLTGTLEAFVTEERNGEYELEMRVSAESPFALNIEIGCYIGVTSYKGSGRQIFEVYEIDKSIEGEYDVYAKHISYRASYIPVKRFSVSGTVNLQTLCNRFNTNAAENGDVFNFVVDPLITRTVAYDQKVPKSLRKCLSDEEGCVLALYKDDDLEYEWDNYTVKIFKNRGSYTGAELRRGKNITSLDSTDNGINVATGVLPYWSDSNGTNVVTGSVQLSSNHEDYPYHRTVIVNYSSDFKTKPTATQLNTKAQSYFEEDIINQEKNIKVSYVDLRQSLEYNNLAPFEDIKLCDTVKVIYPQVGIAYEAKVIKLKWDVLAEKNDEIEVGKPKALLSSAIGQALDYTDISGLVDAQTAQDQAFEEANEATNIRITSNEEIVDDLAQEVNQHDVTVSNVNMYFSFDNRGLTISTPASSIKTIYTSNGFQIVDAKNNVLAEATADEFNCQNGLGIREWHFDIDANYDGGANISTLTIYRKREG